MSKRLAGFIAAGLLVALALAGILSGFADSDPDGLEKVAEDKGFLETARDHTFASSPVADYGVKGVGNERLSTGLAGIIGVTATFALGFGVFALVRGKDGTTTVRRRDGHDAVRSDDDAARR